jgi:WhiB family transcriptional regulator, redox-sensing transcriptional regulator
MPGVGIAGAVGTRNRFRTASRLTRARPAVPPRYRGPADDQSPWLPSAACAKVDPELFFPVGEGGAPRSRKQIAAAKAVCLRCPVIERCRDWALANPTLTEFGIWGGTTREERRALRRRGARMTQRAR